MRAARRNEFYALARWFFPRDFQVFGGHLSFSLRQNSSTRVVYTTLRSKSSPPLFPRERTRSTEKNERTGLVDCLVP